MAAGMHAAFVLRAVRKIIELGERQRVELGPQTERALRCAAPQRADHAGLGEAALHRDAVGVKRPRHAVGGALLLIAQFRMGMDVAPERGQVGREFLDRRR